MGGKRRSHCFQGHEYTPDNIITDKKTGNRTCRTCKYARIAARRGTPEVRKYNREREKERRSDPVKNKAILERLKSKLYRMTPEQYRDRIASQENRCLICGIEFTFEGRTGSSPAVDHDHKCCPNSKTCGQCVRGILCNCCNHGLGHFKDNIASLQNAVSFLESHIRSAEAFVWNKTEGLIGTAIYNEMGE